MKNATGAMWHSCNFWRGYIPVSALLRFNDWTK